MQTKHYHLTESIDRPGTSIKTAAALSIYLRIYRLTGRRGGSSSSNSNSSTGEKLPEANNQPLGRI